MPVKNVLILDTETTGIHPSNAELIEVGALLYNLQYKKVIQTCAAFLPCKDNAAFHINYIEPEWTQQANGHGAIEMILEMAYEADCIVAHYAQFDKMFMATRIVAHHDFWEIPWVCTKSDFRWPVPLARRKLMDVCNAMGVPYVDAHRALTDCQFLADCFSKIGDLQERFDSLVRAA